MRAVLYKLIRPIVQALRWPFYVLDKRWHEPSRWSHNTLRYIGIADPRSEARVDILTSLLEKTISVRGDIIECGVFRGHTAVALGLMIKERCVNKKIYALDSFEGFDETAEIEAAYLGKAISNPLLKKGAFGRTSLELIRWKIGVAGVEGIVIPVKGYFRDTLPRLSRNQYCFVHLDCDLGESYRECLELLYPRVVSGGYICFDEYRTAAWPLTTQVIDEFFRDKPEKPVEVRRTLRGRTCSRWHVQKMISVGVTGP